ncbi:pilin [Neisseria elongata]|uniref:pilin n=1 Tax=Neisseria elongata TaxID=495 RepID=UPI0028EA6E3C|nr:pilin [Neisseria elongata]
MAQAASDIEQRQAERSRREIAVAASETIQNEIRQANEQAAKNAVRNKILFDGFSSASGLRTDIAIFLADHGRMPDSLNEIGWAGGVTSATLSSIRMRVGGILVLHFNPEKLRGTIILTPQTNIEAGMITGWDCTSPDIDFIVEALPECRYQR